MRAVIDKILETEKEADASVQQARQKASSSKAILDKELSESIKQVKKESRELIANTLIKQKELSEKEIKDSAEATEKKNKAFLAESEARFDALAEKIVKILVVPGYLREKKDNG